MDCDDDEVRATRKHKMRIKRAKDNVFKINVPIITNEELERLDDVLENDLDNIVNQISKTISKDRDIIILKKVIDKLQKQNREYEYTITGMVLTRDENFINKDEIKQLIGYEENEDVSKDEITSLLKTMWEEFNRLEDIEDYMETRYISKKKIKEIKEKEISRIQKELVELNTNDILNSYTRKYTDIDINEYAGMEISRVLNELLRE